MSTLPQNGLVLTPEFEALAQSAEWQSVLAHFDFHEGFAFGLLLVPGTKVATACRADLERHLALSGKLLLDLSPTAPEDLLTRCLSLAWQPISLKTGVIWISAVVSEHQTEFPEWNAAFRQTFARFNPVRNILQHNLPCTLLFVGFPWMQTVIRTMAPDLWSVRYFVTTIANIALPADSARPSSLSVASESAADPDPEFALSEAARLRGKAGGETTLIRLLDRAAQGFSARFRFDEAAQALRESLELRRYLKLPPLELARAEIALAASLIDPGHHAAGMPHLATALDLLDDQNINDDPKQLDALNDVAILLEKAGRAGAAKDLLDRIVLAAQSGLGPENPRTLVYLVNLGFALNDLGDLTRARSVQEQAVKLSNRVLGPEHPNTLTAMHNLASTLWLQDDFGNAQKIAEQVVEGRRRVLGLNHIDTLAALENLGAILNSSGDLAGALALHEQVLAGLSKTIGQDHPAALTVRQIIAIILQLQGDLSGAREQLERILEARRRLFGPAQKETLNTSRILARVYNALGQTAEANALLEELHQAESAPPQPNPE